MTYDSSSLTFSVITVCLNAEETIERAIDSVKNQTYPNIEYLIIDGESNDDTVNIVNRNHQCVSFLLSEPDNGIYSAMNKGIRHSNGDVLFFLNADDYFTDENVLADVAAVFNEDPDIELVYGNQIFDHGNRKSQKKQSFLISRKQLAHMTIQHQTIFTKKNLFNQTDGFSNKYRVISDYEWILKVFIELKCQYRYFDRDISVMSTSGLSWSTDFEKERIRAMKKYYTFWEILRWRIIPHKFQKYRKHITSSIKKRIVGFNLLD